MRERKETQRVSYVRIFKMLLKSVREYKKSSILSFVAFGLQACSDCTIPLLMGFMINEMNDFQTNGGNDTQTIVSCFSFFLIWNILMGNEGII